MYKTLSKSAVLIGIASVALSLTGCGNDKPQQRPTPGPSNAPGAILPSRGRPHLRIGRFDTVVRADGSICVGVDIANTGLGPARLNTSTRLSVVTAKGPQTLQEIQTPPIGAGRAVKLPDIIIPPGRVEFSQTVTLRVRADAGRQLDQGPDGAADGFLETSFSYGPDFAIIGVQKDPACFRDPKNLVLTATLGNGGNVNSGSVVAQWQYRVKANPLGAVDPNQAPQLLQKWEVLEKQQVSNLEAGKAGQQLKLSIDAGRARQLGINGKTVIVQLVLDPDQAVKELFRENNAMGAQHAFPPDLPDINVFGLAAFWNTKDPGGAIHLFPLIANTGDADCPAFDSQWFRLPPGSPAAGAPGNVTGGSGDPTSNWQPLEGGGLLHHTGIKRNTYEWDPANNARPPEHVWPSPAQEEGQLVVLKFEADIGNKVPEFTDPGQTGGGPLPTPPNGTPNPQQQPQGTTPAGTPNGPNNSFVWNFQVPRFPRPDMIVKNVKAFVSEDGSQIRVESRIANDGAGNSGPFKVLVNTDGQSKEISAANLPPTHRAREYAATFKVTNAMRSTGIAPVTVRVQPTKDQKDQSHLSYSVKFLIPRETAPIDIHVVDVDLVPVFAGKDKSFPYRPDGVLVRYILFNSGDDTSGAYSTNVSIEGVSATAGGRDEDGILARSLAFRETDVLDIQSVGKPNASTILRAKVEVTCANDKNDSNNIGYSNPVVIGPKPNQPVPLPKLVVTSIGLRPTSTAQNVHLKCNILNDGDADAPAFRVDWWVNNKQQKRKPGEDWAPGLERGASIDGFDCNWCDYKPTKEDGTKLQVMVAVELSRSFPQWDYYFNSLEGEVDINDKGSGPSIEPRHHFINFPETPLD